MAILINIIYPTDPLGNKVGGVETYIRDFIKHAPDDFRFNFFGISSDKNERPIKRWLKVRIGTKEINYYAVSFEIDENRKTTIPLSSRFTYRLMFSKIRFQDGVLCFHRIEPAILYITLRNPKIVVIHNDILKQISGKNKEVLWSRLPLFYFFVEKLIFSSMNYVYTVSMNSLTFYQSHYAKFSERFKFLPTWAEASIFYKSTNDKISIRKKIVQYHVDLSIEKKWVIFAGRLQEQKKPFRLIEVFRRYLYSDSSTQLIVIGEGNLENSLRDYVIKIGLCKDVIFISSMKQEKLAKFYQASDLFLLTSDFEGMPRVILEALSCGTPVVTTDVGEVKRVVKNGFSGEVVDNFDSTLIAQAIEKVLNNQQQYTSENCIKSVLEYTPQKILAPVYEKIRQLYVEQYGVNHKVNICSIKIDCISFDNALEEIVDLLQVDNFSFIATPNIDHVVKLHKDSDFRVIYEQASLVLPDGVPLIWASKFLGTPLIEKISGSDLFPKLCEVAAEKGYRLFFLGGREGAALKAAEVLKGKYPNIQIVGIYSPPFGFENDQTENNKIIQMIKESKPDILFVGLGAPKQEKWIYKYKDQYQVPVSIGIGVSFEFVAGMVKRAPVWMQKAGLEWFWRLMMEPKRLWKRYLIDDVQFFWLVLKQKFSKKKDIL